MNVKGNVVSVLPVQSGEGKNGAWSKRPYIIETSGQYPKKVAVSIWGDTLPVLKEGENVDCSIEVESKEFNGKWYTEVKCWKVDIISSAGTKSDKTKSDSKKTSTAKQEEDFSSFENAMNGTDDKDSLPF